MAVNGGNESAGQHEPSKTQDLGEKSRDEAPSGVKNEPNEALKEEKDGQDVQTKDDGEQKEAGPAGGYDSTPIPSPSPGTVGYTLKFTFHRAIDLSIGDAHVMSSDPYAYAQLNTGLPQRHKEDPNLRFRTPTIRRSTTPEWNEEWIVANVPSSGFQLKVRIYDEDPADHDDQLGKIHISVPSLSDDWEGIHNQSYKLTLRDSSKRALFLRAFAKCVGLVKHMPGHIYMSIEMLGRTASDDGQNGRAYTVGPCRWCRHYSPMLGRLAHTREPDQAPTRHRSSTPKDKDGKDVQRYNFQSNELQLAGPVPAELYHRFVEFKPWVKRMFTNGGLQGVVLGKALHHQHARVYNYSGTTVWGYFRGEPNAEVTRKFLELVHYDQGGRIFTYVLTLDSLLRFTETGKEFGIDMLSKHTMHSDVSIYIAFSGEFFVRRLKHRHRPPPPEPMEETSQQKPPEHAPNEIEPDSEENPPTDPSRYELIIDNDSGTYRPNAKMLPLLASYLSGCLPGLHIQTLDCKADADKMSKMKTEQRERKKREGDGIVYTQGDDSSISSSEDERLDDVEAGLAPPSSADGRPPHARHVSTGDGGSREHGAFEQMARDAKLVGNAKVGKWQRTYGARSREDVVQNPAG